MQKNTCKKVLAFILSTLLVLSMLSGCGQSTGDESGQTSAQTPAATETPIDTEADVSGNESGDSSVRQVTDAAGNVVEVPADISKIAVTPLPWSSVIYAIDGTAERMVCINPGAMKAYTGSYFETLAPDYANLDTTCIGTDFSINMEEMVNKGIQAVVIWDYQTDEAAQLKELGIVPVMVKNETVEELQASFRAIGQLLGKEDRAQEFIDLYGDTYEKIQSYQEQVDSSDKPKVLYLRNSELKLQGNDNFIKEALDMAGADNVAADISDITMEEILKINPDIILLSWFDTFTPDDLYNNTIDGQDWSNVKAVQEKHVYKTPIGIYRWDAPGVETPLMMMWLATLIQPEIFADIDMNQEISSYFKNYFNVDLTEENLNQILSTDLNKNSVK